MLKSFKKYGLLVTSLIFFLIINTVYFWEDKLGFYDIALTLMLFITYGVLAVSFLHKLYLAVKGKLTDRNQLISLSIVSAILIISFFHPFGAINYQKFEAKDLLIAEREGAANCYTTLKLKANNKFVERTICFGMLEVHGDYLVRGDSIFFSNVKLGRDVDDYYKFAVIKSREFHGIKILGELKRFKNYSDTLPHDLFITKNEFKK